MARPKKSFAPYVDPLSILTGRMYLGSFDDSVSRHPWLHSQTSAYSLTRHLILQSLLGPPVCFRIGNILYHEEYFQALLRNEIPIVDLARSGFVQIHTKGETINKTIELRLRQGTNSTERWVREHRWAPGSDVYRAITRIDRQLQSGVGKRRYSPAFNKAFGHFLRLAGAEDAPEFRKIYELWVREGKEGSLTRSDFEKICEREFTNRLAIDEAMSIINSVNHYAYGVGLFKIEERPLIDTSELLSLRGYTTGFGGDDGRLVEFDVIEEVVRNRILNVISEGLSISGQLLHPGPHWARYAELLHLDNNSAAAVAFRALKVRICDAIRQCVNGQNLAAQRILLKQSCEDLSAIVRGHLGFKPIAERNVIVGLGVRAAKYVGRKAAYSVLTGGATNLAGVSRLAGVDVLVSIAEDGVLGSISRIQDSVTVPDPGDDIRELLPVVRSALSWRYMDRDACEADGLI
jgi:hypothetical protein